MRQVAAPGHRRAAAITALELRPVGEAERVADVGLAQHRLRQAELLALVEAGAARQRKQQGEQQPRHARIRLAARSTSWLEKEKQGQPRSQVAMASASSAVTVGWS